MTEYATVKNAPDSEVTENMRPAVHAFDFDGTLTSKDTLIEFIRFAKGGKVLLKCMLRHLHLLLAMRLGMYDNGRAKEAVFAYCFRGTTVESFDDICRRFAAENAGLMRPKAIAGMRRILQGKNTKVVVVSASVDRWVAPFFADMPEVTVIGTEAEVKDGIVTGRFSTPNCYGEEKVRRIKEIFPDRRNYRLTAYGDSGGDRAMLDFADDGYYKPFE